MIFALVGLGVTVWKVGFARRIASDAGLDPNTATAVTLLTRDGLDATYLAATLKTPSAPGQRTVAVDAQGHPVEPAVPAPAPAPSQSKPVAERLQELQSLRDQNLVTEAEYASRRQAIINSV